MYALLVAMYYMTSIPYKISPMCYIHLPCEPQSFRWAGVALPPITRPDCVPGLARGPADLCPPGWRAACPPVLMSACPPAAGYAGRVDMTATVQVPLRPLGGREEEGRARGPEPGGPRELVDLGPHVAVRILQKILIVVVWILR